MRVLQLPSPPVAPLDDPLAALVRRHDRDRFLASLFAPAPLRPALWALLGFNFEIAKIRETVSEPMLGAIRLQWWRDAIAEAAEGRPIRRHIVATPLGEAIRRHGLTRAGLDAMIDGRQQDFDEAPPATLGDLEAYVSATSGGLHQAMLEVLGVRDDAALAAARDVGIAWALTGLIRAIPFHAGANRLYIPREIARQVDLHERQVFTRKPSAPLSAAVRLLAEAAGARLTSARRSGGVPRAALPALLPARIASACLRHLSKAAHDPYAAQIQQPDPIAVARLTCGHLLGRF
jgi:phytoene synthase